MVAFEVVHHEKIVENAQEKKDVRVKTGTEVKFKPETVNNGVSSECININPKIQDLFKKLEQLRLGEGQSNNTQLPCIGTDDCIGICERDSAVTSIKSMQRFYNFNSDTLADAVSYLDRFISKVKVKRRYLSCVTAAAFFLSTKMNEESEHHPTASELASLHRYSWKASDLKRMEKIILDKLGWNLHPSATCLSYIQIIYRILILLQPGVNQKFFDLLVQRSELCMNFSRCSNYGASTLAVSITLMCLKERELDSLLAKFLLLQVQAVCRISDSELFDCQCAISKQLELYNTHPSTHPRCLPLPKLVPRPNLIKRPSFYGNTDLPAIEEMSWNSESSEPSSDVDDNSDLEDLHVEDEYSPEYQSKMSHSYCQLVDQCYLGVSGPLFHYKKCNITVL